MPSRISAFLLDQFLFFEITDEFRCCFAAVTDSVFVVLRGNPKTGLNFIAHEDRIITEAVFAARLVIDVSKRNTFEEQWFFSDVQ